MTCIPRYLYPRTYIPERFALGHVFKDMLDLERIYQNTFSLRFVFLRMLVLEVVFLDILLLCKIC